LTNPDPDAADAASRGLNASHAATNSTTRLLLLEAAFDAEPETRVSLSGGTTESSSSKFTSKDGPSS